MKNLLKAKRRKFNSKKGFTLVELIVAVMILLIVVSASVRGLTLSYRSASMGALKNDAQSVAQRDCDLIMSAIAAIAEYEEFDDLESQKTLNGRFDNSAGVYCAIEDEFHNTIKEDAKFNFTSAGYDNNRYAELQKVSNTGSSVSGVQATNYSNDPNKQYHYYTITRKDGELIPGSSITSQVYKITTYVYYSEKGFVTCEGEVCILPKLTESEDDEEGT